MDTSFKHWSGPVFLNTANGTVKMKSLLVEVQNGVPFGCELHCPGMPYNRPFSQQPVRMGSELVYFRHGKRRDPANACIQTHLETVLRECSEVTELAAEDLN